MLRTSTCALLAYSAHFLICWRFALRIGYMFGGISTKGLDAPASGSETEGDISGQDLYKTLHILPPLATTFLNLGVRGRVM